MHDTENLRPADWVGLVLVLLVGLLPVLAVLVTSWWLVFAGNS